MALTWQDTLDATFDISALAPNGQEIIDSLLYRLLDRYGLTKGELRPVMLPYDICFPKEVVCVLCDEGCDADTSLDDTQQPALYYEECPHCGEYFHNGKGPTWRPCEGHADTCVG